MKMQPLQKKDLSYLAELPPGELQIEVDKFEWAHSIDLGRGVTTKGFWPQHSKVIWEAVEQLDFKGKKVLDIGCWDGLWAFEAEKRGASEIYATDDISQRTHNRHPTFETAQAALNSKCRYFPDLSLFDVEEKLGVRDFDIVLFCGIYYHLKNPLLALSKLRRVMNEGAIIVIEGPVINYQEEAYAEFYYNKTYGNSDPSNWWVPTVPCLQQWVESSYFQRIKDINYAPPKANSPVVALKSAIKRALNRKDPTYYSRHVTIARAVTRKDPKYIFPDPDLKEFNK